MAAANLNVPNLISACRLLSVPVMLFCVITRREQLFTWLLFAALVSDIVDGLIARVFRLQTKLGAFLDSSADMGTYIAAVTGIFVLRFDFITAHWPQMAVVLGFYVAEKIKTYVAYRRPFNAFHTYLSKATAYAQGAFVMSLFFWGFQWYLFYPAMALCVAANIEEMILTSLLRDYAHDVRGLLWVLRARRATP